MTDCKAKCFWVKKAFLVMATVAMSLVNIWAVEFSDVCKNLAQNPVVSGGFTQTKTLAANKRTLKSAGTFVFAPGCIAWLTDTPIKNSLIITKDTVTKINKAGKKTVTPTAKSPAFSGVAAVLSTILGGDEVAIKSAFEVAFTQENEKAWNAILTPSDESLKTALNKITLKGTSDTLSFSQITIEQSNKDEVEYNFSDTKQSEELSDEQKRLFE